MGGRKSGGLVGMVVFLAGSMQAWAGCTITVSTNAWSDNRDGELSLLEAISIGRSILTGCLTQGERNRISGANFFPAQVIPSPGCSAASPSDPRYTLLDTFTPPGPNCGNGYADDIRFANSVTSPIHPGNTIFLGINDDIDGLKPDSSLTILEGPGAGGWSGAAIDVAVGTPSDSGNQIRNLSIYDFHGDGIQINDPFGAVIEGVAIGFNTGHAIRLGDGAAGHVPLNTRIGGSAANQANYLFSNGGDAIRVDMSNSFSPLGSGNLIQGNLIGFSDDGGFNDAGNSGAGVRVFNGAAPDIIGNSIGRNAGGGIVYDNAEGGTIKSNRIGLPKSLDSARPNHDGIVLANATRNVQIGGGAGEGNVISGNTVRGIDLYSVGSTGNTIQGNIVGLRANLAGAIANGEDGIAITNGAQNNVVSGNTIAGNALHGILIGTSGTTGNVVSGNTIGLRGAGSTTAQANGGHGVYIAFDAASNTIGPNNVIAGNVGWGVVIANEGSDGNVVKANRIGLAGDASDTAVGNQTGGVGIFDGADNTVVGGTAVADRNFIAGNTGTGVRVVGLSIVGGAASPISGTTVRYNFIGTNSAGTAKRANSGDGVSLENNVSSTQVRNNLVSGNGNDGIKMVAATTTTILSNQIGIDVNGTIKLANVASGVSMLGGANGNAVGDGGFGFNAIAGNGSAGVFIANSGSNNNLVWGNYIGAAGLGNGSGVVLTNAASNNQVLANIVGGNAGPGIDLSGSNTANNVMRGNYIGTNSNGTVAAPNGIGIRMYGGAANNTVGGATAAERNVISGNAGPGVGLYNSGTSGNLLRGNYIGTTAAGTAALGNALQGVVIQEGAAANSVAANLISGNLDAGVLIQHVGSTNNELANNLIGTNAAGSGPLPNQGDGVRIDNSANDNVIGASAPGTGNSIRYNLGTGVRLISGTGNEVRFNSISSNGGLGIDLGVLGVTNNDLLDGDVGANTLQNYPRISNAQHDAQFVSMTLNLSSTPNQTFLVDAFQNDACDATNQGEGQAFLGSLLLTTQGTGVVVAQAMLPFTSPTALFASGSATDTSGNTSEFGPCVAISPDRIFADGFEGVLPRPAAVLQVAAPVLEMVTPLQRLDISTSYTALPDAQVGVEILVFNNARVALPAQDIVVASERAVTVGALDARCHLQGRIHCDLPALAPGAIERIRVVLGSADHDGLSLTLESRSAGHLAWRAISTYRR